jgi:hypothetical protein
MSKTSKDQQPVVPTPGIGDRAALPQMRVAIADIHPLPGTPEAKALGCTCWVAGTKPDGKPIYAMSKGGCPIRNHNR